MNKVFKSIFIKNNIIKTISLKYYATPKFFFSNIENPNNKPNTKKFEECFTNDTCLILRAKKRSRLQSILTHSILFSALGFTSFKFFSSLVAINILPSFGWGILAMFTVSINYNYLFNKSNTVEAISLSRKRVGDDLYKYSLDIKTMKNTNNTISFDLDTIQKIEEKKVGNYSEIFKILIIDDKYVYMIPSKICLILNDDMYSQLMTGRIKDITERD